MLIEYGRMQPTGAVLLALAAVFGASACSGSGEGSQAAAVAELTVYRSPT